VVTVAAKQIYFINKIEYIDNENIDSINEWLEKVESFCNYFVDKLGEKGVNINMLTLDKIHDIRDFQTTMNTNISKMNNFLMELNKTITSNNVAASNIKSISNIAFRNDKVTGSVSIYNNSLDIDIGKDDLINIDLTANKITYKDEEIEL